MSPDHCQRSFPPIPNRANFKTTAVRSGLVLWSFKWLQSTKVPPLLWAPCPFPDYFCCERHSSPLRGQNFPCTKLWPLALVLYCASPRRARLCLLWHHPHQTEDSKYISTPAPTSSVPPAPLHTSHVPAPWLYLSSLSAVLALDGLKTGHSVLATKVPRRG